MKKVVHHVLVLGEVKEESLNEEEPASKLEENPESEVKVESKLLLEASSDPEELSPKSQPILREKWRCYLLV